jgi:DNA-binding winged helix-turn-helix (wHTH) protein
MVENPFFHRGPIHNPVYFYDRRKEIKQALTWLSKRQSVSVIGPRKIGKTSLLLHLCRQEVMQQYGLGPADVLVYFNWGGLGELGLEELYTLILEEVANRADELGHHICVPARPISFLDFRNALRGMCNSNGGLRVALLLDEFEILSRNQELCEKLFPGLRALAPEFITYVTVSQHPLAKCSKEYSPFFNIFVPLEMGLFDESESRELIAGSLEKAKATFDAQVLDGILELGGGHPFFLQVVGYWALELQATKGSPLGSRDLRILTQTVRSQVEPHFEYYWERLDTQEQYVLAALPFTHGEEVYREQLRVLTNLCLIVKENGRYRYFSPLFRDFVRRQGRVPQEKPKILQAAPFVLVLPPQRVLLREEPLPLSGRLFSLLRYLAEHQGRVVTNEELDRQVLTPPDEREEYKYLGDKRVKAAIRELRKALKDEASCIINKRGVGYVLQVTTEE